MSSSRRFASLLAERAQQIQDAKTEAAEGRWYAVAIGLQELVSLYGDTAGAITGASAAGLTDPKSALIARLGRKARMLERAARNGNHRHIADQLRSLSLIYNGEAEHFSAAA